MVVASRRVDYTAYAPMRIMKKLQNERGQALELTLAFVVAKCRVVEEKEEFISKADEVPHTTYRVVFEWSQTEKGKIVPDYEGDKCTNSSPAKAVFKSVKECQEFVDRQNAKLLKRKTKELFDDEKEAVKEVFYKNERKCRQLACSHLSEEEAENIIF